MHSEFLELFGVVAAGRPRREENPTGVPTGDPRVTELARRRASRVLRYRHQSEFEELMQQEAEFLLNNSSALPVGE
jgi:hypothetical protein